MVERRHFKLCGPRAYVSGEWRTTAAQKFSGNREHAWYRGYTLSYMTLRKRALVALVLALGVCMASPGCTPIAPVCVGAGGTLC